MFDVLSQNVKYLKGMGPAKAQLFNKELGIYTLKDMLHYYPIKYIDRSKIYTLSEVVVGMSYVQVIGRIYSLAIEGEGRKCRLRASFTDGKQVAELIWFQGIKKIHKTLKINANYLLFGTPSTFNGGLQFVHPELELIDDSRPILNMGFQAVYRIPEKLKKYHVTSKSIGIFVKTIFSQLKEPIEETLPEYIVKKNNLLSLDETLKTIHFPQNSEFIPQALYRLKFEELFYVQLNILRYAQERNMKYKGYRFSIIGEHFMSFYNDYLPFSLTNAQKRVIKEMRRDMGSGRQMNRLLQGDVGSGKTIVALMMMLIAIDNGYQACIIAPTEILAEQHFHTILSLVQGLNIEVELLTGTIKGRVRNNVLECLERGDTHIIVGTHALLEDKVKFSRLGLVVIDEQHRFGVAQRAKLWTKSENPPHVLVMTATPIPRTLAMTLYGDLDVSIIDELPPGRKPIRTLHYYQANMNRVLYGLQSELQKGRQAYVVFPVIKESEKKDIQNLEEGYEHIKRIFPDFSIDIIHGQLRSAEKDVAMKKFVSGQTKVLVSTTVIEVGVNVPNASVMIIENAERFGLAQLHQLRGRVGRGAEQSYCILLTNNKLSETSRKRMQIMTETNNGFEIAEEDLKLRGPGDLEGTQQSGLAFDLKIANITKDHVILEKARQIAREVIKSDPEGCEPENELLWRVLRQIRQQNINWGSIS